MPKKAAPVFDIAQFRTPVHYDWREIEREDDPPIRVKLQRLNMRESEGIPYSRTAQMPKVREGIAPFIAEWDLRATNLATGEEIDVPPPSEAGPEVLELLDGKACVEIASWLVVPGIMQQARDEEKKDSQPSESIATHASSNGKG